MLWTHQFRWLCSWGLDDSKVRMGFEYGLSPGIALKLGRSSDQKEFDLSAKVKALKQTQDIPFAISFYTATFLSTLPSTSAQKNSFNWSDQFSFANQLIFVKKLNTNLSFALLPTYLIFSKVEQANNGMFFGVGGRYKLFKRISLNAEYFYAFQEFDEEQQNNLSLGFDIDTGGHIFSLHLSNSRGMNERAFLMDTSGNWLEGDVYFGFNISRVFLGNYVALYGCKKGAFHIRHSRYWRRNSWLGFGLQASTIIS